MAMLTLEFENATDLKEQLAAIGYAPVADNAILRTTAAKQQRSTSAVESDTAEKPKRTRRSKAQIEADNAKAAAEKAAKGNGQDATPPGQDNADAPCEPAPPPDGASLEDIRGLLKELAATHLQECADVLATFNVTKSSDLDPQHYNEAHAKLAALQS